MNRGRTEYIYDRQLISEFVMLFRYINVSNVSYRRCTKYSVT